LSDRLPRRLVFDAGPFILLFTNEEGSEIARETVVLHEKGNVEVFIHPNNLAEAYQVISSIRREKPELLIKDVSPETVVRSAYATLNILQDERTTVCLGALRLKYRYKPWGDLSSAALALRLSDQGKTPVIILNEEMHFEDLKEVEAIKISGLQP